MLDNQIFFVEGVLVGLIIFLAISYSKKTKSIRVSESYFLRITDVFAIGLFITLLVIIIFQGTKFENGALSVNNTFFETDIGRILSVLTTFYLGYISLYLATRKDRSEIIIKNYEEIIIPLYLEIKKVKDEFLNDNSTIYHQISKFTTWTSISSSYKRIVIDDVYNNINEFYTRILNLQKDMSSTCKLIIHTSNRVFNVYFLPEMGEPYRSNESNSEIDFRLIYRKKFRNEYIMLDKYIMMNENPLEAIKIIDPDFDIQTCVLEYLQIKKDDDGTKTSMGVTKLTLHDNLDKFTNYLGIIEKTFKDQEAIIFIRNEVNILNQMSDNLMNMLRTSIDDNYPTEKLVVKDDEKEGL